MIYVSTFNCLKLTIHATTNPKCYLIRNMSLLERYAWNVYLLHKFKVTIGKMHLIVYDEIKELAEPFNHSLPFCTIPN